VALLEKDPQTSPRPADQPPNGAISTTAPDYACEVCGAGMARGQDWCLECGTAAPGRLGARPGWRAAFTVVGLTTVLLMCAVVAAYAALTGDAERTASAPVAGDGNPIVANTPAPAAAPAPGAPVQPGATGPNTAPPANGIPKPVIPVKPVPPAKNTPLLPSPSAGKPGDSPAPGAKGDSGPAASGATAPAPVSALIALGKDAAKTYNQPARAGAEFGPAAYAVDGTPSTVWDVVVPADGQPIGAGLVIDLGKPYALSSLKLATATPGFTVEIYGAKSAKQLPVDVIDKRWIHLTDKRGVQNASTIDLKGKADGAKVQLVLLHLTTPGEPTDPKVSIGDVAVHGAP
jgi:hypothetical protein